MWRGMGRNYTDYGLKLSGVPVTVTSKSLLSIAPLCFILGVDIQLFSKASVPPA